MLPVENLFGRSRATLETLAGEMGLPAWRGRQLFRHLYHRGATDFAGMTDLDKQTRDRLARRFRIAHPEVVSRDASADGSGKLLLRLEDDLLVEVVRIPSRRTAVGDRSGRAAASSETTDLTICVSTQVGCPLACTFCRSGAVPFRRNLVPGEIVAQVLLAGGATDGRRNVVFMGMGEPLLNPAGVIGSLDILTDPDGLAIPARRITVSTVGFPEQIVRLGRAAPRVGIAISLHAPDDTSRVRWMPIGRRYPMSGIFRALENLPKDPKRRITFQYVLLGGENDRASDAASLVRMLHRLGARGIRPMVNLIAFNPWTDPAPGAPHRTGSEADAERFLRTILQAGFVATLRRSRGGDVHAACGQLAASPEAADRRKES